MGHSKEGKAASRERILGEASRRLRAEGLEGLGIASLMQAAGLTHGGFYKHFGSRAELVAAALDRALYDGRGAATAQIAGGPRAESATDASQLIRSYLSRRHRDAGSTGCAISILAGEVGRGPAATKAIMAPHVEQLLDGLAAAIGDDDRAALIAGAMVGALTLARTLPPARSDALLKTIADQLVLLAAAED